MKTPEPATLAECGKAVEYFLTNPPMMLYRGEVTGISLSNRVWALMELWRAEIAENEKLRAEIAKLKGTK